MGNRFLKDMVAEIENGGVFKPNEYKFIVSFPSMMNNYMNDKQIKSEQLSFRIDRVNLPERGLSVVETHSSIHDTFSVANGLNQYTPLSFNIILSKDLKERELFDKWMLKIVDKDNNYDTLYFDDYVGSALIQIYNDGKLKSEYNFSEIFPVSVSDIELAYSETDAYATCTVTMNYTDFGIKERSSARNFY